MLTRTQKSQQVEELSQALSHAQSVVFTTFHGLKLDEMEQLRKTLKKQAITFRVVKNSLLKRAFESSGKSLSDEMLTKPLAVAFGPDDIATAKLLCAFQKEHEALVIEGGVFEGDVVDRTTIMSIALLPGREELYARVVGSISAPLSRLVGALRWNGYAITFVLSQYLKQKESQN
ncbi:50S ribosomal protein L10 [Candidatus Berkelbacteria bacterium CG06_land_8_20_14_3_00_43_10]|uniref:Large ribosomal subunit protein uL10 n=1 Tax=Candidatus Berkelbacteria bacterium CG10_big_fil_rev_8_21_14_0_10_43_14 TaxID=1974515 RepID=A0A2M6R879_9BACT|nr:MAG: 50S ribosomal protein L10 [Candidatus Berkelbacteria bacterium CG10_big_fil_rev_8_21_14_0_10_43_14]PIU86990.1 MAG: 50S ribosomal protein L10 [Candidatus Berkelbacteria bacterium CG06_land_8_20_14_3_00_43_10]